VLVPSYDMQACEMLEISRRSMLVSPFPHHPPHGDDRLGDGSRDCSFVFLFFLPPLVWVPVPDLVELDAPECDRLAEDDL
jgi:hypothetical protein